MEFNFDQYLQDLEGRVANGELDGTDPYEEDVDKDAGDDEEGLLIADCAECDGVCEHAHEDEQDRDEDGKFAAKKTEIAEAKAQAQENARKLRNDERNSHRGRTEAKAVINEPEDIYASVLDGVAAPLAEASPIWVDPSSVSINPELQFRKTADPLTGLRKSWSLPEEPYDVDEAGILLVWRDTCGQLWCVDGHHRLAHAQASTYFTSSKIRKGVQTPVQKLIPVRVLDAVNGWTLELAKAQGEAANKGNEVVLDAGNPNRDEDGKFTSGGDHENEWGHHTKSNAELGERYRDLRGTPVKKIPKSKSGDSDELLDLENHIRTHRPEYDPNKKSADKDKGVSDDVSRDEDGKFASGSYKDRDGEGKDKFVKEYQKKLEEQDVDRQVDEFEKKQAEKEGSDVESIKDGDEEILADGSEIIDFSSSDVVILDANPGAGVLMRVKQCATRANVVTKWGYRYRPEVLQDAVERARKRVSLGLMISEKNHPAMFQDACDANGCGPKFADNHDHKTARVTAISDVQPDGRVYVTREILDTPMGKMVADSIRLNKDPLSVRWVVRNGMKRVDKVLEPNGLDFVTVDDVTVPAVEGAGQVAAIMDSIDLISDEIKRDEDGKFASGGGGGGEKGLSREEAAIKEYGHTYEGDPKQEYAHFKHNSEALKEARTKAAIKEYGSTFEGDPKQKHAFNKHYPHLEGAFDSFGEEPLADEMEPETRAREPNGGLSPPFMGVDQNTLNPPSPDEEKDLAVVTDSAHKAQEPNKMNPEIVKKVRAFSSLMRKGAPIKELRLADSDAAEAIIDAYHEAEDPNISNYVTMYRSAFLKADAAPENASYHSGVSGPFMEMGNELGDDPTSGWGEDLRQTDGGRKKGQQRMHDQKSATKPTNSDEMHADGDDDEDEESEEDKEKRETKEKVEAKMDEFVAGGHPVTRLNPMVGRAIIRKILADAKTPDEVEGLLTDAYSQVANKNAQEGLDAMGYQVGTELKMANILDTAQPFVHDVREPRPGQAAVDKLLAATDDFVRTQTPSASSQSLNPDDPNTRSLRAFNRKIADRIMDEYQDQLALEVGKDKFWASALADSAGDPDQIIRTEAHNVALADSYTTGVALLPNQPTIMRWIGIQAFQDMRMLQFCSAMGPGQGSNGGPGWEFQTGIGRVFKVAYESYQNPTGYGFNYGTLDFGLLTPENGEISEGSIVEYWDTFYPQWRFNATSATIQGIKSIGNGPLNLSAMARNVWHMTARKSRTIDLALGNEVVDIAMEYGATAVSGESYTTGNNGLPNQSVFPGSGTVTINLNPTKTAVTAVAATDDFAKYPVPGVTAGPGGIAPTAAIRVLGGTAVGQNASPYFGANTYTRSPIVRPRTLLTLTSGGADSSSTQNAISMSAPASMVRGELGPDGYIYATPAQQAAGSTPTYAIDYSRGVIVFASGVTGAAGVLTTTVTVSYSYATNFDYFPIVPGMNGLAALATGETPQMFYSRLLGQFDLTAGAMASWPRFVAPDLAIMSAVTSAFIAQASIFFKLNDPKMTELYPSADYFASRNGVDLARINAPLYMGNDMIILTRKGCTKYAIDTVWSVKGPAMKYGSSGGFIAGEGYLGHENSAVFTPQTKDGSGTIINPVSRMLMLLGPTQV